MTTLLQRLAAKVAAFGPADITPHSVRLARTAIIDTLGAALAGTSEPAAKLLRETPGVASPGGPCTVFGTQLKTSALDATFRCRWSLR